jgi:hypothetical protein
MFGVNIGIDRIIMRLLEEIMATGMVKRTGMVP